MANDEDGAAYVPRMSLMRATSSCAGSVPGPPNARRHAASSLWSGAGAVVASTCTRRRTLTPPLRRLPGASLRRLLTAAGAQPPPLPSTVFINTYVRTSPQLTAASSSGSKNRSRSRSAFPAN